MAVTQSVPNAMRTSAGTFPLCASADDPRCSPLSAEDTPTSPELPARASATLIELLGLPARPLREVTFGTPALLGPAMGPEARTYRPPRG